MSENESTTGIISISYNIKIILKISIDNLKELSGKNTTLGIYLIYLITFSFFFIKF